LRPKQLIIGGAIAAKPKDAMTVSALPEHPVFTPGPVPEIPTVKKIRTLIVDDQLLEREVMRRLLATSPVSSQDLTDFESRTTLHRLENGWTFIIVERPVAPVFSFATLVNVGGARPLGELHRIRSFGKFDQRAIEIEEEGEPVRRAQSWQCHRNVNGALLRVTLLSWLLRRRAAAGRTSKRRNQGLADSASPPEPGTAAKM
jgi:hypothetical protein